MPSAWNSNCASIGVSSAQVLDLATGIINARAAFTSVTKIRADSKSVTLDFNGQATVIHDKAAGMIGNIMAFAEASGDAATVYTLANISPTDAPTPAGAPVTPSNVRATVQNGGNVLVEWDGSLAQRTFFEVLRIVDSAVEYSHIASVDGNSTRRWSGNSEHRSTGGGGRSFRSVGVRFSDALMPAGTGTTTPDHTRRMMH